MLDGVHFESAVHGPRAIGRKAMNRNLSDCAAMACLPAAAVATLALPRGAGLDYARELYLGMAEAGEPFGCPVVGGDTGTWAGPLAVTVTVLGRSAGVEPVTRSGARPGDGIYVTGPLGGSRGGRHMTFAPRVRLARDLAARFRLHAMADVSDGLLRDLRNLCDASGVGADVDAGRVPIHGDVSHGRPGRRRSAHAMTDGEDYELLIASPDPLPPPCVRVGTVTAGPGFTLATVDGRTVRGWPGAGGWEHAL